MKRAKIKPFENLEPVIESMYVSRDDMPRCSFCRGDIHASWILIVEHIFGEFDVNFCKKCLNRLIATAKELKKSNPH